MSNTIIKTKYSTEPVPAGLANVTVKITGEMTTHDGVAFNADVLRGARLAGTIENQGNGGGTWFHHHTVEDLHWWDALATEYATFLAEHAEADPYSSAEDNRAFYREHPGQAHEALADALFEDAALKRDLDRKRSPLVRFGHDNDVIRVYRGFWDEKLVKDLQAEAARDGLTLERWVKGQGWATIAERGQAVQVAV